MLLIDDLRFHLINPQPMLRYLCRLFGTRFDVDDNLDNPFRDVLRGRFTPEETLSINLLRLMRAIWALSYAYQKVMKIIQDATHQNIKITSTFSTRKSSLAFLIKRFQLSPLLPKVHTKIGTDHREYCRHLISYHEKRRRI